jgi:uncharacterized protein (TIGR03118 family)
MKKSNFTTISKIRNFLLFSVIILGIGCKRSDEPRNATRYEQVNLVANTTGYNARNIDSTLINAWGIAFSPGGNPWVNSQAGHVSDVYNSEGVTVLGPVHIPSPEGTEGGNPTGIVFNASNTDFLIPGGAARFIFVGLDGVISAWNPSQGTHAFKKFIIPGSAFTGLALASHNGNNQLYAANFQTGKIYVLNKDWNPVSLSFTDPNLPGGYSPFNIERVDSFLYVTYAKVASNGESEAGVGLGFVNIFRTDGSLVKRFASNGKLNAPWGITKAPAGFFDNGDKWEGNNQNYKGGDSTNGSRATILIGNFGDGKINAYRSDGTFLGQLKGWDNKVIEIEGLWAITFPPSSSTIDPRRLYFAAGPDEETHGLFGYIIPR